MHYHVSRNIVGYLPESEDGSYPFDDWESARDSLADDIDRWAEGLYYENEGTLPDDSIMAVRYDDAIKEVRAIPGPDVEIDIFLPSSDSEHALDVHFWLVKCSDDCEVEE